MSVAFRREEDEAHKEPRFELPIPPGPNLVTRRGLAQIEAKIAALEAETNSGALAGDLLEERKRDLRYWHARHITARVAAPPEDGEIGIGSRVTFSLDGEVRTIEIVGGDEAEPAKHRIAFSAPLARAMIGQGEGDRVDYNGETDAITILAIETIA